jgi:hypothetical protein
MREAKELTWTVTLFSNYSEHEMEQIRLELKRKGHVGEKGDRKVGIMKTIPEIKSPAKTPCC